MPSESLSFDILARDRASGAFRDTGRSAADLAGKMDLAARNARVLDEALDKSRKTTTVSAGATLALAKADKILADAEHTLADGALEADFALKKETEAARKSGDAAARAAAENRTLGESLKKVGDSSFFKPSGLGIAAALSPALIPLAGSIAGAAGAIGVSFGAAAIGVGAFGLLAKLALTQAGTAASAVETAQNTYNAAIASGTKKAVAYRAEQKAINLAYAEMSPAQIRLSKQVGDLQNAWQGVQKSLTPVIGGALLPWLNAATIAMKLIKPFVTPVAAVFRDWGTSLDKYFKNPAAFSNIQKAAAAFGKFSASQLRDVGRFIADIAQGVFNLGKDFASSGASFGAAGTWLAGIGAGFLSWSKSSKARGEVQGFLHYLHTEGPVVKGILSDLGTIIPGIFKGATTTGTLELQAIGELLSLVSKLPKGWQAPLTEAAGAILLLSKTGVVKVGFTVAGATATWVKKLLGGASVDLGAAGMQAAGDTMAGAAAAMQKAADTMVGAGAESGGAASVAGKGAAAAGVAGGGILSGVLGAAAAAATPVMVGVIVGALIKGLGDKLSPQGSAAGKVNNVFHSFFAAIPASNIFSGFLAKSLPALAGFISTVRKDWADLLGWLGDRTAAGVHVVEGSVDNLRHSIASTFDGIRHNIAAEWDTIWSGTISRVRSGIDTVVGWFKGLPGRMLGAFKGIGSAMWNMGSFALTQLWAGLKSAAGGIIGWLENFAKSVVSTFKKIWGWFSPSSVMFEGGKSLMEGLAGGIKAHAHKAINIAAATASGITGAFSGSARGEQKYAEGLFGHFGWGAGQLAPLIELWNRESGWNPLALNPSSGAFGIAQALGHGLPGTGGKYGNQYPSKAANEGNAGAQIAWGLGYIRSAYGSPAAAWAHEVAQGWYGSGLDAMFSKPTLIGVGERGPEHVQVTPARGRRSGGETRIVLELRGGNEAHLTRVLMQTLKDQIRVSGGGDVQVALGSG